MKKIFFFCLTVTTMMALIVACVKELDVCSETELMGTVVEKSTMTPVSDVIVKVTDGEHVHSTTTTGEDGTFHLKVDFRKINKYSYLYFSKSQYTKKEDLHGMGKEKYNYKYIELYDKTDPKYLPTVVTIVPYRIGTTARTGGEVTNDGGLPVTARGVCYGSHQNPDLSSSSYHTNNGDGIGSFSSSFTVSSTGVYYIRAYATNENGTSYGKTYAINDLPKFSYNGHTYKVAPATTAPMTWYEAMDYCNKLTLYGYEDWKLPTREEMAQVLNSYNTIGGFEFGGNWWTSTESSSVWAHYWCFNPNNGSWWDYTNPKSYKYYVRPIRVDY